MLRDDINKALIEAQKAKNERAVSTLRMVNSTLKNADIEARGAGKPPLGDAEVLPVLQKMIKQRQELVELYQKGNRADLVKQEQEEIAIISAYLPKQMSEPEMTAAIEAVDQGHRRRRHEGHGQGHRRLARQICWPDGHGESQRAGEGEVAVEIWLRSFPRKRESRAKITKSNRDCTGFPLEPAPAQAGAGTNGNYIPAAAFGSTSASRAAHCRWPAGSPIKSWRISMATCGMPRASPCTGIV